MLERDEDRRRRVSSRASLQAGSHPGEIDGRGRATRTRCAPPASSRTPRSGGRQIVAGLDATRRVDRPGRRPGRGRLPRREAARARRRASTSATSAPERVVETTIQHHIRAIPARREPVRVRRERGRPRHRARRASRTSSRAGSRTRRSRSSATSRSGSSARGAARRDHVLPRARHRSRTRPSGCVELVEALGGGEAALEAARLAKADQASELVREFPELEGHVGAEYARLAGYPGGGHAPRSTSSTCPTRRTRRCRRPRRAACSSAADKIDTLNVSFGLGQRPTGSRDPYGLRRAAIGLDRLATEGNLGDPRAS